MLLERFYPDEIKESAYVIDYERLYREGYRGLIFDIDNTLVEHGADADERAVRLMERLKKTGFEICLLSNNKQPRVERFNEPVQVRYIYDGHKPGKKGYLLAMEKMGTKKENTVFIGDQLFTDVWGAKRIGIRNILVRPIDPREEIQIVLKRRLEWIILKAYEGKRRKEGRENG